MGMREDLRREKARIAKLYRTANRELNAKTGRRLRLWRVAHGMNQTQLGKLLGISQPAVSLWESGSAPIDLDRLGRLCPEILEALENEA